MRPYSNHQAKLFATQLTLRQPANSIDKLSHAIASARVDLNPHQVDAALFAVRSPLSKGVILADEVGLGKTIEAGIVISQKWAERKRKLLIIAPATLRKQWQQELMDKFSIPSTILENASYKQLKKEGKLASGDTLLICSYNFAANKADVLEDIAWDLVVVDEAHRLRNVYKTGNKMAAAIAEVVAGVPKLLLTATFARNYNLPIVKPFMLVVAKDTSHADRIVERIKRDDFFGGRYKDKVITVHSNQRGDESDETIARLLAVEDPAEPTEIVVHVDKLKEGWDVRNLYTIVPLRAANSTTLVEQSIGRGLRLPYAKRMGVAAVDRLTIVAHDKFDAIINEANKPNSIIRSVVRIGKDVNLVGKKAVTVTNTAIEQLIGHESVQQPVQGNQFELEVTTKPILKTKEEQAVVNLIVEAIKENERRVTAVPNLEALIKPDVQERIAKQVTEAYETTFMPKQAEFAETSTKPDIAAIVKDSLKRYLDLNIGIPRISVRPKGNVRTGFTDFDLDVTAINQQPVDQNILIQHLRTSDRQSIHADLAYATEEHIENYIVRNLVDFDDINYDEHAEILFKLSSQLLAKLRSYLQTDEEVLNVVQYYQKPFANHIHSQMQKHWWQKADDGYDVVVSRGYQTFTQTSYTADGNEKVRNVHQALATGERDRITGMVFGGFERCSYSIQKFSSDSERMFASLLEKDPDVKKWFKPTRDQFAISYRDTNGSTAMYEPDFVVETNTHKFIVEPKQASLVNDPNVQAKKSAAVTWCENATKHELSNGGKAWAYVLVPHTAILPSATLKGLVQQYKG
jgi:type III restriction enzyme